MRYLLPVFFLIYTLMPQLALAHSPIKGMGNLFNGILHPLFIPAHVLVLLALGLLLGQHKPASQKVVIYIFMFAISSGLLATAYFSNALISLLILLDTILLGIVIMLNFKIPKPALILFSLSSGLILGLGSSSEDLAGTDKILALLGSGIGSYLLLLYSMALSETLSRKNWQKIVIRVIASWITASALMVLALNFSSSVSNT